MNENTPHMKRRRLRKNGANQRRKNQGKSNEVQHSLELLEVPISLEQYLMVIPPQKKH